MSKLIILVRSAHVSRALDAVRSASLSWQRRGPTPAIVAQADYLYEAADSSQLSEGIGDLPSPAQSTMRRVLPISVQVGFVGIVALVVWWSWFKFMAPTTTFASESSGLEATPMTAAIESLAIVNPNNLSGASSSQTATSVEPQVVAVEDPLKNLIWVTPTSASSDQLAQVETAGNASLQGEVVVQAAGSAAPGAIQLGAQALTATAPLTTPAPTLAAVQIVVNLPTPTPDGQQGYVEAVALQPGAPNAISGSALVLLPTPTPTLVDEEYANIPRVKIVPALGLKLTPALAPTAPFQEPTPTPTMIPDVIGPGRLWSTFRPLPPAQSDHFWVGSPFASSAPNQVASPNYQFGSTAGNRYRPHHGLDMSNPSGTPILAAVEGQVVHAGPDDEDVLGPYPDFYGRSVVILLDRKLPVAGGELDVYVLYGHMSSVTVEVGQHVAPEDVVGLVGMTGIAIGPHLHVEVRLGANTYAHSVNPYLWLRPEDGNGAVALRILTANSRTWAGAKISIARFEGGVAVWARQIETYLDTENIGPDPAWGENGAMGGAPAGHYFLIGNVNGQSIRAEFDVRAGETSFVEIRLSK